MFNTRLEVDRHVESCFKRTVNEQERNLRCLAFSKLYFKVGDFEQAHRYLSSFLTAKPASAEGLHLLGKILEKLGKKEAALEAYKGSLEAEPRQNSLVLKICELLASDDVSLDKSIARYYCDKAQSLDPYNPVVTQLKGRLITMESEDPQDVSQHLLKEIETQPLNIDIRIHLVKHLLHYKRLKEAYAHVLEVETKNPAAFANSLKWYETVSEVLVAYQREHVDLNWQFWMFLVSASDKLVSLTLDERVHKSSSEYLTAAFNFDQNLMVASEQIQNFPEKQLGQEFLNHYTGQLCFHFATLLLKQARRELIKHKEVTQISLPLLFAAYNTPLLDLQSIWLQYTGASYKPLMQRWHMEGAYRLSQVGHMLLSMTEGRKNVVLEKAKQNCTGSWRANLFKKIFVARDNQAKMTTSYFNLSPKLNEITIRLPDLGDLSKYDSVAQLMYPDSIHHYIWIGLNHSLPTFECVAFQGLQYSVKDLNNCSAESLNLLDIQAFVYCAVLCAQSQSNENKLTNQYNLDKLNLIPCAITDLLGTPNQAKWLKYSYKMFKKQNTRELSDIRVTLIRGIEVVRCVGNHGLDAKLLVHLANIFSERAKNCTAKSESEFNDVRAEIYWKTALAILEKLNKNQAVSYSANRLFVYKSKGMSQMEILQHIDKGKLFTGVQLMKKNDNEQALKLFQGLNDPYASFYRAQIYKAMADQEISHYKENVTSEMRSQHIILLTKSRDCLYLTLDRLRDGAADPKHPLNDKLPNEIEKIERLLSRIDPDTNLGRNDCEALSDENVSSIGSENYNYHTNGNYSSRQDASHIVHSTPLRLDHSRREARPSPERLDVQLRQLMISKDATLNHLIEQNRIMVESHRGLVEELGYFREAVDGLTSTVNELNGLKAAAEDIRSVKSSVEELKNAVDDLQAFKNVTDLVYEMKKELAELKKEAANKPKPVAELGDEDLYVLDDDYAVDYANITPTASSLYGNFRMPPAAAAAAVATPPTHPLAAAYAAPALPLAGLYHPMYHHYTGISPLHTFPAETQVPEYRPINALPQPLLGQNLMAHSPLQATVPHATPSVTSLPAQNTFPVSPLAQLQQQALSNVFTKDSNAVAVTTAAVAPTVSATSFTPAPVSASKAGPVNVVITSSDPLPVTKAWTSSQVLSVTIPPQHIKGNQKKPHNYQIALPATSTVAATPSIMSQSIQPVSTTNILSNVAPPVYSSIDKSPNSKNASLGFQIEKSLSQSFNNSANGNSLLNKSNFSNTSLDDNDPIPDFKPIIPLPEEVPVTTGEENETVMFAEHAKLFRYFNKEWKERGVGVVKILKNNETGNMRLLMRRDQVHKICANHMITNEINLNSMKKQEKAWIWAAKDFSEGELTEEKFCIRFKTIELAKAFFDAFEKAKQAGKVTEKPKQEESKPQQQTNFGGFKFTSAPSFMPKEETAPTTPKNVAASPPKTSPFAAFNFKKDDSPKANAFASFTFGVPKAETPTSVRKPATTFTFLTDTTPTKPITTSFGSEVNQKIGDGNAAAAPAVNFSLFGKTGGDADKAKKETDDELLAVPTTVNQSVEEEFEPTTEFKPVVSLPDLIDVTTGEENAEVMYESRAKLLRFDTNGKEWKERGVGQMKVLKENTIRTIRLVMRRDQIHKVCCNHQLLKSTLFSKMKNNVAISWYAQDYSEGVLNTELFALRFKTEDQAQEFFDTIQNAQDMLDDKNTLKHRGDKKSKPTEAAVTPTKSANKGWGDVFKSKVGNWECKNCYVSNEGKVNKCVACETPKNAGQKETDKNQFCFGVGKFKEGGFGDAFKPKEGSWECKECYSRNEGDYCLSCECPRDGVVPVKEKSKGIDLSTGGLKFNFGINAAATAAPAAPTLSFQQISNEMKTLSFSPVPVAATATAAAVAAATPEQKAQQVVSPVQSKEVVFGSVHTGFEFTPRSPRRISSGNAPDEESESSYVDEEEDNIYFKPVISLPEKVEVKTGEEDEKVLYCHRAKLYRRAGSEWKERGIGDLKILLNECNKKLRVLMRREQVHKICLNHWLTKDISYTPKDDDKTWLFSAADFSEGEVDFQVFCVRFKTPDIAVEFKKAVDNALAGICGTESETESSEEDDVIFVSETQVSKEEEEEAKRLGLPPKFMAYRRLPDCVCEQCKKEDAVVTDSSTSVLKGLLIKPSKLATAAPAPTTTASPMQGIFSKPAQNVFTAKTSSSALPQGLFGSMVFGASSFGSTNNTSSSQSFFGNTSSPVTVAASVFGNTAVTSAQSVLSASLFSSPAGATPPTTKSKNLFDSQITVKDSLLGSPAGVTPSTTKGKNLFDSSTAIKESLLGSPAGATPTTTKSKNLFESSSTVKDSLLGTPASATPSSTNESLFSSPAGSNKSLFGTPVTSGVGLFGSTAAPSIFGNKAAVTFGTKNDSNTTPKLFGSGTSLFGGTPVTSSHVFASSAASPVSSDTSIFSTATTTTASSLFGGGADSNPFGDEKLDGGYKTFSDVKENPFVSLGAGSAVFASNARKSLNSSEAGADESGANEDGYDPHYEPIVPLPDEIVLRTGEEDEQVLFNERGKLYRYNANEWKERGVGQIKILHDPVKGTYRMLLRRDQVHKIVLNQRITSSLEMQRLTVTPNTWMWAGHNCCEDKPELEKLAVRFKLEKTYVAFKQVVDNAVADLKETEAVPKVCTEFGEDSRVVITEVSSTDASRYESDIEDGYEREDDDDEDDDDRTVSFAKSCTVSELLAEGVWQEIATDAEMQIMYDPDAYGSRVVVCDPSGYMISNSIIGKNSNMIRSPDDDGHECEWRAVEYADDYHDFKTLKATFDDVNDAQDCHLAYLEGISFAEQAGIIDDIPHHIDETDDHYE